MVRGTARLAARPRRLRVAARPDVGKHHPGAGPLSRRERQPDVEAGLGEVEERPAGPRPEIPGRGRLRPGLADVPSPAGQRPGVVPGDDGVDVLAGAGGGTPPSVARQGGLQGAAEAVAAQLDAEELGRAGVVGPLPNAARVERRAIWAVVATCGLARPASARGAARPTIPRLSARR